MTNRFLWQRDDIRPSGASSKESIVKEIERLRATIPTKYWGQYGHLPSGGHTWGSVAGVPHGGEFTKGGGHAGGGEPPWHKEGGRLLPFEHKGLLREQMPQLSGFDKEGKFQDLRDEFIDKLRSEGTPVDRVRVPASHLKATQSEMNAEKVEGLARGAKEGDKKALASLDRPIVISKDGYVIDGHHKWGARRLLDSQGGAEGLNEKGLNAIRLGLDADNALARARAFSESHHMTAHKVSEMIGAGARAAGLVAEIEQLLTRGEPYWLFYPPYPPDEIIGGRRLFHTNLHLEHSPTSAGKTWGSRPGVPHGGEFAPGGGRKAPPGFARVGPWGPVDKKGRVIDGGTPERIDYAKEYPPPERYDSQDLHSLPNDQGGRKWDMARQQFHDEWMRKVLKKKKPGSVTADDFKPLMPEYQWMMKNGYADRADNFVQSEADYLAEQAKALPEPAQGVLLQPQGSAEPKPLSEWTGKAYDIQHARFTALLERARQQGNVTGLAEPLLHLLRGGYELGNGEQWRQQMVAAVGWKTVDNLLSSNLADQILGGVLRAHAVPRLVSAARGERQMMVGESSSAGALLPVGQPIPPVPRRVQLIGPKAKKGEGEEDAEKSHGFRGGDLSHCQLCGHPATDPVHGTKNRAATPIQWNAKGVIQDSPPYGRDSVIHDAKPHGFKGPDLTHCEQCGCPIQDDVHTASLRSEAGRGKNPYHLPGELGLASEPHKFKKGPNPDACTVCKKPKSSSIHLIHATDAPPPPPPILPDEDTGPGDEYFNKIPNDEQAALSRAAILGVPINKIPKRKVPKVTKLHKKWYQEHADWAGGLPEGTVAHVPWDWATMDDDGPPLEVPPAKDSGPVRADEHLETRADHDADDPLWPYQAPSRLVGGKRVYDHPLPEVPKLAHGWSKTHLHASPTAEGKTWGSRPGVPHGGEFTKGGGHSPGTSMPEGGFAEDFGADKDYHLPAGLPHIPKGLDSMHLHGAEGPDKDAKGDPVFRFSKERQAFHDKIIERHLAGQEPTGQRPRALFMGGGTASGKTKKLRPMGTPGVMIDADELKSELPEYRAMLERGDPRAANFAHEESSYLAKRLMAEAIKRKLDFTLDGTGDSAYPKMEGKVNQARDAGYTVRGRYATVDVPQALAWERKRAEETGRKVNEEDLRNIHRGVTNTFAEAVKHNLFDQADLYHTGPEGVSLIGSKPEDGIWSVHNPALWERFLRKGDVFQPSTAMPEASGGTAEATLAREPDVVLRSLFGKILAARRAASGDIARERVLNAILARILKVAQARGLLNEFQHQMPGPIMGAMPPRFQPVAGRSMDHPSVIVAEIDDLLKRHGGSLGHLPLQTGHVGKSPVRRDAAHRLNIVANQEKHFGPFEDTLKRFFARQEIQTRLRLNGRRGQQLLRQRAQNPPGQPPTDPSMEQPGQSQPSQPALPPGLTPPAINPAPAADAIFDMGFWNTELAEALHNLYEQLAETARSQTEGQLGMRPNSIGGTLQVLENRPNLIAGLINQETFNQIEGALQEGMQEGEGTQQLAKRVKEVFDEADQTRAERIARTETVGALNTAAYAYAKALPPGIIGAKRWASAHDQRVRPAHRVADGQVVPLNSTFMVGPPTDPAYPMMHPGDWSAPPNLVIGCRCSCLYLPNPRGREALLGVPEGTLTSQPGIAVSTGAGT